MIILIQYKRERLRNVAAYSSLLKAWKGFGMEVRELLYLDRNHESAGLLDRGTNSNNDVLLMHYCLTLYLSVKRPRN